MSRCNLLVKWAGRKGLNEGIVDFSTPRSTGVPRFDWNLEIRGDAHYAVELKAFRSEIKRRFLELAGAQGLVPWTRW